MPAEAWWMMALAVFFVGVQLSLGGGSQRDLDEATMLPFADDPAVARRVERDTGRSTSGCACPGTCDGSCKHHGQQTF
ncbi:cbb3-type cytochrome c oxidase subunit 3 [Pseudomonas berkeleyensis]|uniref:Cbb3-type cytochrome c oxidase subunit 3 n=1 Tax=Pseudomonas berkeleyensis TaxID=2726956 RepID=A0A7G5DJ89_9PSED|nr:cbb3-type cytochrome c oxidase subunit 3 [Pseudomonas berkeleyensis]QMV61814.1 cbb3-type cytochrome c oxidase subunit 3 [Pseudomonas berkeleyensis]WSO37246.1 cbb3-type cytochrome c oxidase subunit 3 [Pseudomonas berkeleyensis]